MLSFHSNQGRQRERLYEHIGPENSLATGQGEDVESEVGSFYLNPIPKAYEYFRDEICRLECSLSYYILALSAINV